MDWGHWDCLPAGSDGQVTAVLTDPAVTTAEAREYVACDARVTGVLGG